MTCIDPDLYGSFPDEFPTAGSSKSNLFVSNSPESLDEIQLCGTLGSFPRAINDTFRFCAQPTSLLIQGAPGYFYIGVFGFQASKFQISVVSDKCHNETCSNHGECGKVQLFAVINIVEQDADC